MEKIISFLVSVNSFFKKRKKESLYSFIAILIIYVVSGLPYFNLFLSGTALFFAFTIVAVLLMRLHPSVFFLLALVMLIVSVIASLLNIRSLSENASISVVLYITIGFLCMCYLYIREGKHKT